MCEPWIASSEGFLILAIISWFVAMRRSLLQPVWTVIYLPMALYVVGSILSALFAPAPGFSLLEISDPMLFLILPLALSIYERLWKVREAAWRLLVFIGTFAAVWALIQFFVLGWTDLDHRITGPNSHVMTFSGMIMIISLMMLGHLVRNRDLHLLVPLLIILLALILTYTRGAWIGWIVGAAWIVLGPRPKIALAAIPLLILALLLAPLPLFGRLVSVFDPTLSSNLDRIRMAQAGIEMIRDHPVVGIGPGNIEETYPFYRASDAPRFRTPHLHSNPFQIWAERGVVTFVAYHLLFFFVLRELWRRRHRDRAAADSAIAATIAFFIAGLTEYNFGDGEVLMTWLDGLAVALAPLLIAPRSQELSAGDRIDPA